MEIYLQTHAGSQVNSSIVVNSCARYFSWSLFDLSLYVSYLLKETQEETLFLHRRKSDGCQCLKHCLLKKLQQRSNGVTCCRQYKWLLPCLTVKTLEEYLWTGCFQQGVSAFSPLNINHKLVGGSKKRSIRTPFTLNNTFLLRENVSCRRIKNKTLLCWIDSQTFPPVLLFIIFYTKYIFTRFSSPVFLAGQSSCAKQFKPLVACQVTYG